MEVNRLILAFIIILAIFWVIQPFNEKFNENTMEFVPIGQQRFGLRSDPLNLRSIENNYISANRHIRLNNNGGMMFESSYPPHGKHCTKVSCPNNTDAYDELDTCWKCGKPGCISPACASYADCSTAQNLQKIWPRNA